MTEKDELHRQLNNTIKFIDNIIEQQKIIQTQITKNYNFLLFNYKNKINELEVCKCSEECLRDKLNKSKENCKSLKCQLKENDDKYMHNIKEFIESYNQLKAILIVENNNVTFLKDQKKIKNCLNIISKDFNKTTKILNQQNI